jgi:hypothetical protein
VYYIGYQYQDNQCCKNGDVPLVSRANTHYKCGQDGSLENNCTLLGGSVHVLFNDAVFREQLPGVTVEGFTFQRPEISTVMASGVGGLSFINCVFRVRVTVRFWW